MITIESILRAAMTGRQYSLSTYQFEKIDGSRCDLSHLTCLEDDSAAMFPEMSGTLESAVLQSDSRLRKCKVQSVKRRLVTVVDIEVDGGGYDSYSYILKFDNGEELILH